MICVQYIKKNSVINSMRVTLVICQKNMLTVKNENHEYSVLQDVLIFLHITNKKTKDLSV